MHRFLPNALKALVLGCIFIAVPSAFAEMSERLEDIQDWIETSYPEVPHISAETVTDQFLDQAIIFDVREPEEYAVSKLKGAVRVDPEISAEDFLHQFGDDTAGKQVLFYCSVGRRSSLLASKVQLELQEMGAQIHNLKGGIFNWHDNEQVLENASGTTDYVHPFSWRWKRYLKRKGLARYKIN